MSLWKAHGIAIAPDRVNASWYGSHIQVPVVDTSIEGCWRIYFSGRDVNGRSHILYADVERGNPGNILQVHDEPILPFGAPGTFDDSGTMPTHIQIIDGRKFLYYIGWTPKSTVPYQNSIGVVEVKGNTYEKLFDGPVIGMDAIDPYFTGTFFCIEDRSGLKGYYLSTIGWVQNPGMDKLEPLYDIKSANSTDGIKWEKTGESAIPLLPNEGGLASAAVIRWKDRYLMWYARRGKFDYRQTGSTDNYDLGFAISEDGVDWKRMDAFHGLPETRADWESQMRSYPYVVADGDHLYLFYNGNGFGRSGIGYASCSFEDLEAHIKLVDEAA